MPNAPSRSAPGSPTSPGDRAKCSGTTATASSSSSSRSVTGPSTSAWSRRRACWSERLEEGAALVFAEDVAHRAADLAQRGVGGERLADRVQQVAVAAGDVAQALQLRLDRGLIAALLEGLQARELALLGLRIDLEDVDVVDLVGD